MTIADDALTPRPEHRFTFGLWTVGNPGRDPFGGPTREPLDPVDSVRKLAELGAWGISLHDEDLVPYGSSAAERDRIVARFKAALEETGLGVGMATTNLFTQPVFKDGAFTSNDRGVRRAAIGKAMRSIDLGAELGAEVYVFWGGREGTEAGVAKDPRDALDRYREAINVLADYSVGAGLRPALRDGAQAERAARRRVPPHGRARAALHLDARPAGDGRRQPGGRARDDGRAVLPPRGRAGAVGRQAVPHRPQRAAASAATTRTSASAPRTSRRRSCWCGCSSAPATPGRGTSTRTRTATRTPRACGTSRAGACAPTSRSPRRRATSTRCRRCATRSPRRRLPSWPRRRRAGSARPTRSRRRRTGSTSSRARGYANEALDQLLVEVLLGAR